MARYTLLQENDIQTIARAYGMTINHFEAMEGGAANSSYRLNATRGDFVLTVFDSKEWGEVIRLGKLLNYLDENDFSTTNLLPRLDGAFVTKHNHLPVIIKQYIHGDVHDSLTTRMLNRTGEQLAELHEIPPPDFLPLTHSYGKQTFSTVIGKGIDVEYESWLAEKHRYLMKHIPKNLPRGLIHGDLFRDNLLFKDDQLRAMIDFEEACNYFFVFDIGMGIVGQCREGNRLSLGKAKEFVSGYQRVRKLETRPKESLKIFVVYAAVATSYWRFWNYNIFLPTPKKQTLHREMMRLAEHIRSIPKKDFNRTLFA
jgi:homoserine kinase type II